MSARNTEYKKAIDRLSKKIRDGYGSPTEFHRQTGIPVANYTISRALDNSLDCPAITTVIIMAAYAGMKNREISELLTDMGDTFWPRLLKAETLSMREQNLLDAIRIITDKNDRMWGTVANNLDLMASAVGVDITRQLAALGKAA
jgi:hypothetical protein